MWGLTGPEFLLLYWIAVAVVLGVTVAALLWVREAPVREPMRLDVYGVAFLAGGSDRVAHTALAGLASRGAVHVSRSGGVTPVDGAAGADPYEDAVLRDLRANRNADFLRFDRSPVVDDLVRRMRDAGYLNSSERADRAFRVWWLWALVVGTGVYRIVTGMIHDHPVGYLIASTIAAGIAGLVLVLWIYSRRAPDPTRRGRDALANATVMVGGTLLLPVALAGLTAHPDPEMGDALATATDSHPHVPSSDSGGGSSGDSGSSCGSSGCGGGCGGCS